MVNLLYAELLKLKRAQMFLVSVIGASAVPVMIFISALNTKIKTPDIPIHFAEAFGESNMYVLMLIGPLLYGVITSYLFSREFTENTLKNLLTIPVSRVSLIASKMVLLLIWIIVLTLVAWVLTFIVGLIFQFEDMSINVLLQSIKQFMIGAFLLFLLSAPTMLVTFLFKNYVPTIIFTAAITMANIAIVNSEYKALFPWSAVHVIASNGFVPEFSPFLSYLSILLTSLVGLVASIVYFKKLDIH
ncbi:ABC transporter permease [Bacillus gobiensis]|uniref:ABC transporter permease n=1 Tax=Bacillus gobiensis TaxID=1441095 RepID=UPI003D230D2B